MTRSVQGLATTLGEGRESARNWIFQGNALRSDVLGLIAAGQPIDSWKISHHYDQLQPGDRAALWVSGEAAGIYAVGIVTGYPYTEPAGDNWAPGDRGREMTFVPLLLDDFLGGCPITKAGLAVDRRFSRARILTQPQAGNPFATTDEQWEAIEERRSQPTPARAGRKRRCRRDWAVD